MNLDSRTTDKKLFSRFKYYNGLPHTAEDIHGDDDLSARKSELLLNHLFGNGLLGTPQFGKSVTSDLMNIRVESPFPVNINGDIFLVGSSDGVYPVSVPLDFSGTLVLVCWVSSINNVSKNYEYGCMRNTEISMSDLIDPNLNIQVSSRYQVRYDIIPISNNLSYHNPVPENITISSIISDAGEKSGTISKDDLVVIGHSYRHIKTSKIPSEDGFYYIIPIANISDDTITAVVPDLSTLLVVSSSQPMKREGVFWYNVSTKQLSAYINGDWKNLSGLDVKVSNEEPESPAEGLLWYNPDAEEFKIFINTLGFISLSKKIVPNKLVGTYEVTSNKINSNITFAIPISSYTEKDLLELNYNGVELTEGLHYTVNKTNKTVTLISFTCEIGDTIYCSITRFN